MLKKASLLSLIFLLLLGFIFGGASLLADSSTGESTAIIKFVAPTDSPPVLDPDDPTEPYDPDPNDPTTPQDPPTDESGALTLDYVSSLDFGEQVVSSETKIYESTVLKPFIQVSDRRGTAAGWTVTAQASHFKDGDETDSLSGAKITLLNGESISPSQAAAPTPVSEVELIAGGDASIVVTAAEQTGMSTWITRWYPSETTGLNNHVLLEIPGGVATLGNHTATITWTLTDAPGQ